MPPKRGPPKAKPNTTPGAPTLMTPNPIPTTTASIPDSLMEEREDPAEIQHQHTTAKFEDLLREISVIADKEFAPEPALEVNQQLLVHTITRLKILLAHALQTDPAVIKMAEGVEQLSKDFKILNRYIAIQNSAPPPQHAQTVPPPPAPPSKPTYANKAKSARPASFTPPKPKAAPLATAANMPNRQLVIVLSKKKGKIAVDYPSLTKLNKSLRSAGSKTGIIAVNQTLAGNLILNTAEGSNATDLLPYKELIISHIFPTAPALLQSKLKVNKKYYEFRIDFALRINPITNTPIPAEKIWEAVQGNESAFKKIKLCNNPKWLGDPREGVSKGSIIAAVDSETVYNQIIATHKSAAYGNIVYFTKHVPRMKLRYCGSCGSTQHLTWTCVHPKCLRCSSSEHDTNSHPADAPLKCINCRGNHHSTAKDCPVRLRRLGKRSNAPIPIKKPAGALDPDSVGVDAPEAIKIKVPAKPKKKPPVIPAPNFASTSQTHIETMEED